MRVITYDKVDSKDWILSTAYAEREMAFKTLNNKLLWNLGEWGNLLFLEVRSDSDEIMGRAFILKPELVEDENIDNFIIGGLHVYPWFLNKGVATLLIQYCINLANEFKIDFGISTNNENLVKLIKAKFEGFVNVSTTISRITDKEETLYKLKYKE